MKATEMSSTLGMRIAAMINVCKTDPIKPAKNIVSDFKRNNELCLKKCF